MLKPRYYKLPMAALLVSTLSACVTPHAERRDDNYSYAPPPPEAQPACAAINGSIYQCHSNRFLFEDMRARRVGDLLTIVLQERTNANKSASTSTSKDSSVDIAPPTIFGRGVTSGGKDILDTSIGAGNSFSGSGDSSQSNSLTGNITVSVVQVLSNGNLVVRGEKALTLNQGTEIVRVTGIVRPIDITAANQILSTLIADARISYSGRGMIADSNAAGWVSRFFNSPLWPL